MRFVPLVLAILLTSSSVFASEIREFDLKTVAQLGREMNWVSQRADKGATDAVRRQAQQTAIAALKGRLFNIHYDFLVVNDPDGSGFLVYAMPSTPGEIVLGGNFRVMVSPDGSKAERIDAMARTLLPGSKPPKGSEGQKPVFVTMSQVVSNKPLETCVYTSLHYKTIVSVGMANDNARVWCFNGDKIFEITPEMIRQIEADSKKEKKK